MTRPATHYFEVQMEVPASKTRAYSSLRFVMPVWTPGSYLVREFARNVIDFHAHDSSGRKLRVTKETKNSWSVALEKHDIALMVEYRVYAHEFSVSTSFLDSEHGIINGASVFMYLEGRENEEAVLTITPHESWKVISTGLERLAECEQGGSFDFLVPSFDILVDSPIEIGNQKVQSFEVNGVSHEVSVFGLEPMELEPFFSDVKKIVENTWPIFGEIPYNRYVFIVDFSGGTGGGGLEHLNSTHCIAPRLRMAQREEYDQLMGLFSHEFFHAWNVKRMRPKELGPFNYSQEMYTKSLWISEGVTSYYDDLILRRAMLISVGEYLDAFSNNVNLMLSLPGPNYESAQEASFDTWIRFYMPDENSANVVSSYYVQGAVIGWMIDMEIRKSTASTRTLDDVMKKVYRETFGRGNRGFSDEEFEAVCNDIAGKSLSQNIFDKRVRGRERVDFNHYLGYAGLKLGSKKKDKEKRDLPQGFLGIKLKNENGRTIVSSRLFDTPAEYSGLSSGDEILGADGLRLDQQGLTFYVSNKVPDTLVRLTIARNGRIEELPVKLGEKPDLEYRVYKLDGATQEQKDLFAKWMKADWHEEIKYPDYAPWPYRTQIFDYV
jgi:predicted metalloprotease with PDZ domain